MAKRNMNWTGAVFTASGQGATPATFLGVSACQVDDGANLMKGAGDADPGPTTLFVDYQEPVIGLKFESIGTGTVKSGDVGSFSITLNAAPGGSSAGSGAITYTLSPCTVLTKAVSGQYRKFADADVEFHGFFEGNGLPNPLTTSIL